MVLHNNYMALLRQLRMNGGALHYDGSHHENFHQIHFIQKFVNQLRCSVLALPH